MQLMRRPSMEKQRVEACDGLNQDTGGGGLAFRSVSNGVFINVYEHNDDFGWQRKAGGLPAVQRRRLPSSSVCLPKTLHRQFFQSSFYPLQTSRNRKPETTENQSTTNN